ncbi:uncharacterized protein N7479_010267 [Penicillium vulpinum]|uniref:Uncharacterized protein n=1 Tax=Penicillium vulpinum TaxID=29845 RepID=A0A1V6RFM3_9EURO|nr:uncharacterized protein N7479_010267 [Penicillium vulpinum]KAJ5951854.1 hypothetical protein N7479_010267 [Penicillium vulpinum]OQE00587.1 hypothetical protein PENVUL_c049G02839 [Penicillium vulpinum]
MLELGIILLELWQAQTFGSYVGKFQKPYETLGPRYDTARNWLEASIGEILLTYAEVVTRCIECTFAMSTVDMKWNDKELRKSVYRYVVKPLGSLVHPNLGE